jgi:hypothetical protein
VASSNPLPRLVLAFGLALPSAAWASPTGTINLSHDLVRLGIAAENLPANDPSFDARPIFQVAVAYAAEHQTTKLTVDRGSYYFLTPEDAQTYLRLPTLSNLTLDLAGSKILFAGAFLQGITLSGCQNVTLTNFDVDFLTPPYTEVTLASVDANARTLGYAPLPGWADPATFDAGAANQPPVPVVLWAMAFRHGNIVPGTSRMQVAQPIAGGMLELVQDNTPWTQAATLGTLQEGDTIVVTERGGQPPILAYGGTGITISHGTVRAASAIAVLLNGVSHSTVDGVSVMPRPGSLISSNADGIHFVDAGADNHIRHSYVTRTMDDALAMDALDSALVVDQTGPQTVAMTRRAYARFADGSAVDFVDPVTDAELPGGVIVSQVPADSSAPVFDGPVTLTFDRALPSLAPGAGMVFSAEDARGQGSSIEDNRVADIVFGRGIWLGGVEGVTVARNAVGHTSNGGIAVFQSTGSVYPLPPAADIAIEDNTVRGSLGPMASGSGTQIAVGAILVDSVNDVSAFVPQPVNRAISILRNTVSESGRSGIWVGEVSGGAIRDNAIVSWNRHPDLPLFGVDATTEAQLKQDFKLAIVVHDSQQVELSNNNSGNGR